MAHDYCALTQAYHLRNTSLANMAAVIVVKEVAKVHWSESNKRHFVTALMNEAAKGSFVDNGFKKQSWHAIQQEFHSTVGFKYDKQQLHSHYGVLKKKYNIYKALVDNSGFGIDPNNGGPTAADDVWSAYLEAHPDASEFRGRPFVYFDDLDSIFTGKVATGKYFFHDTSSGASEKEERQFW